MIKLFRHIRKNLLMENKTGKYLKYAIGEIVLVVIGILIALQINNWNENRKDRTTEKTILVAIAENLQGNIDGLEFLLNRLDSYDQSGNIISDLINHKTAYNDSLNYPWMNAIQNGANFALSKSGFESLKNTGIQIISDNKLKSEVINLYENTYLTLEGRLRWGTEVHPTWDKYLLQHFQKGQPYNYDFVVNDNYFKGLVELAANQRRFFRKFLTQSLENSQEVLDLIQEELK